MGELINLVPKSNWWNIHVLYCCPYVVWARSWLFKW